MILTIHALTQWNVDNRSQGHTDTPLNDTGIQMAESLAQRLHDEPIEGLYASDLKRAYQTAEPLAEIKGLPILRDERLREGRWATQERGSEYPVLPFPVSVESPDDVKARMVDALHEIAGENLGKRIFVVSHGAAVRQFIAHVRENTDDDCPSYRGIRCALNVFRYDGSQFYCVKLNDDVHIKLDRNAASKDKG